MALMTLTTLTLGRAKAKKPKLRLSDGPDSLVSIVSHDLKGPLTAIQISVEFIRHLLRFELGDKEKKLLLARLEGVEHSADQALSLVKSLLDVKKIETGNLRLSVQTTNPKKLISCCLKTLKPLADQKSLNLVGHFEGDESLECDGEKLKQVFSNLISNAIEHTPPGGNISVGGHAQGKDIRFFVKDSGDGIPADQQDYLFELYWRGPENKNSNLGLGMGLSIAKGIVEAHGGRIWVESEVGRGTTFYFTIPQLAKA